MWRQSEKLSTTNIYTRSYIGVGGAILLGAPILLFLIRGCDLLFLFFPFIIIIGAVSYVYPIIFFGIFSWGITTYICHYV